MRITKKGIFLAGILITILMFGQATVFAAQSTFKDIKNHWAEKEIKQMVDKKYIFGYSDGTFRPNNQVTKLDALVLSARVLGVDEEANSEEVIAAQETYKSMLNSYKLKYGTKEISFLLNRKIFSKSEIDTYIKGENAKLYLKRYEAAILFTKIMGREGDVKNITTTILPFEDLQQIPLAARPYVQLMNEEAIMLGITKTQFKPNTAVTRAQIAIMLLKVSNKIDVNTVEKPAEKPVEKPVVAETTFSGTIDFINKGTMLVIAKNDSSSKSFTLLSDTPIKLDNSDSKIDALERGYNIKIKSKGDQIIQVDATSRTFSKTITGKITSIVTTPSIKIGILEDVSDDSSSETYIADDYIQITKDGSSSSIDALEKYDFGTIYLTADNKVGKLVVEQKDQKVSGTVQSITTDDKVYITIKENDSETNKYEVLSDVTVTRNGSSSNLKDIKAGDTVKLSLTYNQVTNIQAQSDTGTVEGTIDEILISDAPKLTIKVGTKEVSYAMDPNAKIRVDSETATIYDLKVGAKGKFNLDSNVIVSVDAEEKVDTLEVKGKIKLINLSLGIITVQGNDSTTTQIYVNSSNTKVSDVNNQNTVKLNQLEEGDEIIAYGKNDKGVFVTSIIILTNEN